MNIELIEEVLEALLFVSGDGLSVNEIAEILELQKSEINKAIGNLKKKYSGQCGIHLVTYNGKIQFGTNPNYADTVSLVLNPIKEKELSSSALETVAIIAYRQPITRLEIEQIRGVNCDYAVQLLLKHNMIEAVGRLDAVGKPILFGTTDAFLKRFQIEDLSCLPDYEKLLDSIRVIEDTRGERAVQSAPEISMYNEFDIPDEEKTTKETNDDFLGEEEIPDFLEGEKDLRKIEAD